MKVQGNASVRSVFDEECSDLVFDDKFVKKLVMVEQNFVNKNDDHNAFFGGNLLGVHRVSFTDADRNRWFDEILNADEKVIQDKIYSLPDINPEWIVSSNAFNNSCIWLVHKLYTSNKLSPQMKHQGMVAVLLFLQYKFFTSRYHRHFLFLAKREDAEAAYVALSGKFLLKKLQNWRKVFLYLAEEIINPETEVAGRVAVFKYMDNDKQVIRTINDIQGRIRDMLLNLYDEYLRSLKSGKKIVYTSQTLEHDGEEILKDKKKSVAEYQRYLVSVISDKNSFIREELVAVIVGMQDTMSEIQFRETLAWMSDNYQHRDTELIDQVIRETIIHSIDYLSHHREAVRNRSDLPTMLVALRGGYTSSRSTDPVLYDLRKSTEEIVRMATHSKNESAISSVRTGVLLYIVLRSYTMRYYKA